MGSNALRPFATVSLCRCVQHDIHNWLVYKKVYNHEWVIMAEILSSQSWNYTTGITLIKAWLRIGKGHINLSTTISLIVIIPTSHDPYNIVAKLGFRNQFVHIKSWDYFNSIWINLKQYLFSLFKSYMSQVL